MSNRNKKSNNQRSSIQNTGAPGQGKIVQKPKNFLSTVTRLAKYMKSSVILIFITLLIAILGTIMQVLSPKILGNATTLLFNAFKTNTPVDLISLKNILLFVGVLYVGSAIADYLQTYIMTRISQKTTFILRNELKAKLSRVPISYFDKHSDGNLMSIVINDMDNIATTLQQSLTQLISSIVLVIGTLWFMITISPILTLIAVLIIPASYLVTKILSPRTQENFRSFLHSQGKLNGHIEETFNSHMIIKSFGGENQAIENFDKFNNSMYESGWKAKFFGGTAMPAMMVLQNINYIMIAIGGALQVASGSISIGNMQAFLQYSTQISRPISQFSQIWNGLLSTVASAERVFEVLDAEEESEYSHTFPNNYDYNKSKVQFSNVSFGYTDSMLMKNFNLNVEQGKMIAIVGHTGAGKTTLINLIERFYEIDKGNIFIDGIDIRNLSYKELRSNIGMVLQDTWLFSGTIYDNIKYGNEDATEEEIYNASKLAYVDDFVRKLPDGYNTILNEEVSNISQGQRQLITIARAFVKNPEILILDEATSNVDSRIEMLIQEAMKRLLKGRTSFVVAHRLSTIYEADNIIVMEQGNIIETGKHQELLAKNGTYTDIYNSQFTQIL